MVGSARPYTSAEGLGKGKVRWYPTRPRMGRYGPQLQDGGGLSRIKDGRITTLTTRNGLPCDTINWSIEDDDRSLWLYTACGLVRISRSEVERVDCDPKRRMETTFGMLRTVSRLRSASPAPTVLPSANPRWQIVVRGG